MNEIVSLIFGLVSIIAIIVAIVLIAKSRSLLTQGALKRSLLNFMNCLVLFGFFAIWQTLADILVLKNSTGPIVEYISYLLLVLAFIYFAIASYSMLQVSSIFGFKQQVDSLVKKTPIKDYMSHKLIVHKKDGTINDISKLLHKHNISSVLITEDKKPIGIVTERDIVHKVISEGLDPKSTPISKIMITELITADINDNFHDVSERMRKHHIKQMPITKEGHVVGMFTSTDLIKASSKM